MIHTQRLLWILFLLPQQIDRVNRLLILSSIFVPLFRCQIRFRLQIWRQVALHEVVLYVVQHDADVNTRIFTLHFRTRLGIGFGDLEVDFVAQPFAEGFEVMLLVGGIGKRGVG